MFNTRKTANCLKIQMFLLNEAQFHRFGAWRATKLPPQYSSCEILLFISQSARGTEEIRSSTNVV